MNAILTKHKSGTVLVVFYSTVEDGHDWNEIIEAGRHECGVGDRPIPIICIPQMAREVLCE
jgi:hypothetical protein